MSSLIFFTYIPNVHMVTSFFDESEGKEKVKSSRISHDWKEMEWINLMFAEEAKIGLF